jgi:peptide chain release factor 3
MHHRIGKEITLAKAITFMARERSQVEEAWPGDIIGIHNHGTIKIGDTFSLKEPLKFKGIPNFAPELFKRVILKNPLKTKQLNKGLIQLSEEGAIQFFRPMQGNDIILGAVGELQFDVTIARLKAEYSVDAVYEPINFSVARWVEFEDPKEEKEFERKNINNMAIDSEGYKTFLTTSEWQLGFIKEKWPKVKFHKTREHD